jgi:DNA-binding response OmpR family regulator
MSTTARVLVADGDPALRRALAQRLELEGFEAFECDDPASAPARALAAGCDLVLLGAPADQTASVLEALASIPGTALVAMLDAECPSEAGATVLDLGADDYVVKPLSPRDLVARTRAVLRRTRHADEEGMPLGFGDFMVDPIRREVFVQGRAVRLTAREFDLLLFLARHPGRVFTRAQLLRQVWGDDAILGEATVTEHVRRIRAQVELDPRHPVHIHTIWSVGYRFDP